MGILVDYDTLFRLFIESTTQQTKNIFLSLEMVLEVMYNIVTEEHLEDILFNSILLNICMLSIVCWMIELQVLPWNPVECSIVY